MRNVFVTTYVQPVLTGWTLFWYEIFYVLIQFPHDEFEDFIENKFLGPELYLPFQLYVNFSFKSNFLSSILRVGHCQKGVQKMLYKLIHS